MTLISISLALLGACVGGNGAPPAGGAVAPPTLNVLAVTVDAGPAAATGQINHPYVTVHLCAAGSKTACADIDHVLLDTGSTGLRLVGSVLAAKALSLSFVTDAQGQTMAECAGFGGGQVWGPVALADVTLAGEVATKLPIQVMDDTGSGPALPASCGATRPLLSGVAAFGSNGVLGVGVLATDCGPACAGSAPPAVYYGCPSGGACSVASVALAAQVQNPVTLFPADNNGVIVNLPNLQNANGDPTVSGELVFGLATQADNALPLTGLTVLGTDTDGKFTASFNGDPTVYKALIDSGAAWISLYDPSIAACQSGRFSGFYCPAVAPQPVYAINTGVGANGGSNTVNFAIADPNSFAAGAYAFSGLAGGGVTDFVWGMPFFYGRKIYVGIDQRSAGSYTGPYFAY